MTWKTGWWLVSRVGASSSTRRSKGRFWWATRRASDREPAAAARCRWWPGEVGAHHQGVGEEADQRLELDATAVGDRRADQHRVLPRVAVQEGLEGGQQRHEDGDALAAGELADGGREFGVELERELAAPEPLDRRTGPVQG